MPSRLVIVTIFRTGLESWRVCNLWIVKMEQYTAFSDEAGP